MSLRRISTAVFSLLALSACGKPPAASTTTVSKVSDACSGQALPHQFIVKHLDGSTEVVQSDSEETFLADYAKKNAGNIEYAEHDFRVTAEGAVHVETAQTTTVADNWGAARVQADSMWAQNQRGDGIVVAVVDTGADVAHPQLVNQLYVNPGESGTDHVGNNKANNGVDDDSNGYIDDVSGYDFVNKHSLTGDDNGHGTHVSGIIAAAHQDSVAGQQAYVQGIAPKAKILPLKFLDSAGSGNISDAILAIQYAVAHGARVINASWGGSDCSQSLRDTITALAGTNVVFVNAAGNSGVDLATTPEYPAALNLTSQITVGAVGDHDLMSQYSNYGVQAVHIFAPGDNIVSTWPQGQMAYLSGTSMATPFVSGAMAVLISAMPSATVAQLRAALYSSASHDSQYLNASKGRMALSTALTQLHSAMGQ